MLSFHKKFNIMASPQLQVAFNKPTPVSKFFKILIQFCIIPLKINRSENKVTVTFKYKSKQTLIFLFYQLILIALIGFMSIYMTGINQIMTWFMAQFQHSNIIDFASLIILTIMINFIPTFYLPSMNRLTNVENGLILSPNLQLPNHWKKIVLSSLVQAVSTAIHTYLLLFNHLKIDDEDFDFSWWLVGSYIQIIYIYLLPFIFFFVVFCLIDEFKRKVCLRKNNIIQHAGNCIDNFKTRQNGLGTTFLIFFLIIKLEMFFSPTWVFLYSWH